MRGRGPGVKVLLVSSFVLPHAGGVEQFVATSRHILESNGKQVRVLACRLPNQVAEADAVLPTRYLPPAGWPVPTGGLRTLWKEVGATDVVIVNGSRQLLPVLSTVAARLRRTPVLLVLHGSGDPSAGASLPHRLFMNTFVATAARLAVRLSRPVSVSRIGVLGARRLFGVECGYLPYPIPALPPATPRPVLALGEPLRVAWVGRLHPEKDPLAAVAAVERVRSSREATLEIYGEGFLRTALDELARSRPWLALHGAQPWSEILRLQTEAHVCLSTSVRDNVQVATLEALSRGIPVVATRVGDAPGYYLDSSLARFCVPPRESGAIATALLELASSYRRYAELFEDNGRRLSAQHERAPQVLVGLVDAAGRPPRRSGNDA